MYVHISGKGYISVGHREWKVDLPVQFGLVPLIDLLQF